MKDQSPPSGKTAQFRSHFVIPNNINPIGGDGASKVKHFWV